MRGGVILIAIALVVAYLGVTGRYMCFGLFAACINNPANCAIGCGGTESAAGATVEGNSGVNPTGAPIYDARNYLPPIEAFV